MNDLVNRWTKNLFLLLSLSLFVLAVNHAVIYWDMMYIEQPIIYKANQTIHSLKDFLNIYLHPKLLDTYIPFFRPSGHFLLYQLITPLLGWHNTKAFLVINLLFLALTGYFMIKLYEILFPGYKTGGYIAFALYLMQPALILSRITIMHFEFAHVCFVILSCYCFALFCQKNLAAGQTVTNFKFNHAYLFWWSLFFNVFAITFKEPALMLGPVLAGYLIITLYNREPLSKYIYALATHKTTLQIILLCVIVTIAMAVYLTLPWLGSANPWRVKPTGMQMLASAKEFFLVLISAQNNFQPQGLFNPTLVWRNTAVPLLTRYIVWSLLLLSACSVLRIIFSKQNYAFLYKKSLVFLLFASLQFLLIPICWAMGFAWHANLALVFFSLLLGFGADYFFRIIFKNHRAAYVTSMLVAILIGLNTVAVNRANIAYISASWEYFYYTLNRNAIFNPPQIKEKLNAESVIVVEDNSEEGEYYFGDGHYPWSHKGDKNADFISFMQNLATLYVPYEPLYNGSLFRWAYLMPNLKEELYPFKIEQMQAVPDAVLVNWVAHFDNIFCLGYDDEYNWHDRTEIFKRNLLVEKARRHFPSLPSSVIPAQAGIHS